MVKRRQFQNVLSKSTNWIANHSDYALILVLYVLVTILFTWPLAANFTTFFDGNKQDIFHELWYLHFGSTQPTGPFFDFYTNLILYPNGVPLYFQVMSPLHTLMFALISKFFGEVVAYNTIFMFTFFIAAFTMYILVLYLTKNKYAAFFAGLVFGFAPIHTAQGLTHLNIMASELLPLFAYFLIRLVRERSYENGIYAGILMVLNAMLDLHMLLMAATITISFLIFYFFVQRRAILNKSFISKFLLMISVAALLGIVVYFQTFYGLLFAPKGFGAGANVVPLAASIRRSSDLLMFFIPGSENPFFGSFTYSAYHTFLEGPQIRTYIGYSALSLAILGLVTNYKKRDIWFWAFLSAIGFLLVLGPFVEMNGKLTPIPGVWQWLYYVVPFFKSFRTPFRFDYLVMIGVAVLAGYGVSSLTSLLGRGSWATAKKMAALVIVCSILVIEFIPVPYPMTYAGIPAIYSILANDHSNYTVIEVPLNVHNKVYLYYQSLYNKPLFDGHISRTPQISVAFLESTPFINQLGTYIPGKQPANDIINETINATAIAPYILAQYNVKYIIVHKNLMTAKYYYPTIKLLSSVLGPPFYNDSQIIAYLVPDPTTTTYGLDQYPKASNSSMVTLLYGPWYTYGEFAPNSRAIDYFGGLSVFSSADQYMQLGFRVEGMNANFPLQLTVNNEFIGTYVAWNNTYSTYTTPFIKVHAGLNQVIFNSVDGCTRVNPPVSVRNSTSSTSGSQSISSFCLSAQFQWIDTVSAPAPKSA